MTKKSLIILLKILLHLLQEIYSYPNLPTIKETGNGLSFQMLCGEYDLTNHFNNAKRTIRLPHPQLFDLIVLN
jgi:hypothetical protein